MDDDESTDPNRRALILALGSLPVVGGAAELIGRALSRPASREAAKVGARAALEEPGFPLGKAAEAMAERPAQERERRTP